MKVIRSLVVLFVPDTASETSEARGLLKPDIPRSVAIHNISRIALLVLAFQSSRFELLREATEDMMHQSARCTIMPHIRPMIEAALHAGAHGAFLSGAGSTIAAISSGRRGDAVSQMHTERHELAIAEAFSAEAKKLGMSGRVFLSEPSNGAYVADATPPYPKVLAFQNL